MTNILLASEAQTSQQKPLFSIYCDLQNVSTILNLANLLLAFVNSKGRLSAKKVYYNSQCENQASGKNKLESLGFSCVDVPCSLKNSADNQLIADCIEDVSKNSPDIVILVSGDSDFAWLVSVLKKLGKKVIIFAQRGNVKQRLKDLADEFYFVEDLPNLVVKEKNQRQTTSVQCKLTYKDATVYLLEAIATALSQGKRTGFPFIDNLMRQRFPNYRGVSSICECEGKKFSKFSKFVAAVVAEGKVKINNKQLFLMEK